jgi:N-acyl-D-amino-acid deacylase
MRTRLAVLFCFLFAGPLRAEAPSTGEVVPGLASFDELAIKFLADHQVPGMAIAVARDGMLIYSRGFGYADKEKQTPVRPDSLFRIASISKPITSVAILQLVERGKLKLDDKVLDVLKLELPKGDKVDARWREITIRHLLQHAGGWDRSKSFDAMFKSREFAREQGVAPPAGPEAVIKSMLGYPLDFAPGERSEYSNFGYCLLGRLIEKVTGQSYEAYVKEQVLKPAGVTRMKIGATLTTAEGEVRYYDRGAKKEPSVFAPEGKPVKVPMPYGVWSLEAMDAHGGWIASAPDLLRFASIADGRLPGVLGKQSIETMFALPDLKEHDLKEKSTDGKPLRYYGCGWAVRVVGPGKINTFHSGGLQGTSTLLVRRYDGLSWAVLLNSDFTADGGWLVSNADPLMHAAAAKVKAWPKGTSLVP